VIAIIFAGATAMFVSMFGTRIVIRFFQTRGKGQPILGKEDLGPEHHMSKAGTPTMGGLAIVVAAFAGWMVAHVRDLAFSRQAEIAWIAILVMAGMGFLDDYLKVKRAHNRGVFWKKKSYITFTLSLLLAWWMVSATNISTALSFTRSDLPGWHMPWYVWVLWAATMIWATSNAVNVTDGLDGLAAGSAMMGFLAFTIIGYVALRYRGIYSDVVNPLDLAVLAAAFAGACAGFLWFNAAPARIFMGDVGALALGTALALLALTLNTHLLLILICGINVMEAGSVGIQMIVFKASGRKKRLFKMSPIHHHFELVGWPETTVIIRFWLISGICVASALALFIADFTKQVQG